MTRTSAPADTPAPGGWEELVTAALLGTERRTPPGCPPGRDAPLALLDAAAAETVRRRAGLRPGRAAPLPEPVGDDPRPPLPAAATRRLAMLLADRPGTGGGGRRGTAPDLMELLPQWLATANARGFAAPPEQLPALLDAARGRTDLRPSALTLAGPRAVWLARLNPDWRFALRATPGGGTTLPHPEDTEKIRQLWQEGLFAERVALLSAIRAREPAAARELLTTTWATERAEDRLMFLDSLRTGLAADDESFLEQALTDRSRNVRATAAELLSALPGSALAARMAVRAGACVAVDHTGDTPTLSVEAPHECDPGMESDGVVPKPPAGRGERSWWLAQLVEAAPLGTWPGRLGGRTPQEIVSLPVADDWQGELHAAWCRAAVRQRDAEWARALLGAPAAPEAGGPGAVSLAERAKLLGTLDATERADWVAGFISAHGLSEAFQLLGVCAVPWTAPLGRAVVDALNIARDAGSYPWSFSGVMGMAERCLDPSEVSRLDGLLAVPDETEDASPGAGGYWAEAFQRLVTTLRLRAAMQEELGVVRPLEASGDRQPGRPERSGNMGTSPL
ncbi:HEAT repeat domain-containing protein OS=Streptomyces alboniger OX=132473 GN=CP975_21470 PE=4 SV=1 [Streptomyces alboniger]